MTADTDPKAIPLQWAGCYTLHLYCRHSTLGWPDPGHEFREFPHEYTGRTHGACARHARRDGWVIHRDRTATCPRCSRRGPGTVGHRVQWEPGVRCE